MLLGVTTTPSGIFLSGSCYHLIGSVAAGFSLREPSQAEACGYRGKYSAPPKKISFMNRREFIEKACLSGIAIVGGVSMISSLDIATLKAAPRPGVFHGNREIPLVIADTPELQTVGGAYHLEIDEIDKNLLVVRTGDETFLAVDIKCTHKACDLAYQDNIKMFVCPCHESRFDLNGIPKGGPAKEPLGTYKTSFKNGEVTVYIPVEGDLKDSAEEVRERTKTDSTKKN
ncbi:MAG: ubiquinol-cytochrome c reductase iron-sulfur subunit [Candidatus Kapaibacterium sp.]